MPTDDDLQVAAPAASSREWVGDSSPRGSVPDTDALSRELSTVLSRAWGGRW